MSSTKSLLREFEPPAASSSTSTLDTFRQRTFLEWTVGSGINPVLVERTVRVVPDTLVDPYSNEVSYPIHEALNWKVTRFGFQARSTEFAALIFNDDGSVWQVKLSQARFDANKGKHRKYERVVGSSSRAWMPQDLPLPVWQRIASRYGVALTQLDTELGFRCWLCHHPQVPLILCEGAKKAACLLSLGYAAVALPGVWNGYRSKDALGNPVAPTLIPDLEELATAGRQVYICFDHDLKPSTLENVNLATKKLGKLLTQSGCQVRVIQLPGPEKGVDDYVVAQGAEAFADLYNRAVELDLWSSRKLWELTYKPSLTLNQRYLGEVPFPQSGFAFVKSPKGTGKTKALQPLIQEATRAGRRVLVVTHRIQLGRAICADIGIDWIEERRTSMTQGLLGFGLCIDSLHPESQARFNPQDWREAIIIFDELEQIIWHLLNSVTCSEKRVLILEQLKELLQTVHSTGGLIIGQDADLSDVSVKYLLGLVETPPEPWMVVNNWKPELGWQVHFYDTPDPTPLVAQLEAVLEQGGRVFVCLDSQKAKSRWGSVNLERYLQQQYPNLRILRIDSESVADPSHPAYGVVERLDDVALGYELVIASPTIGTGVDHTLRGHYSAVFGIFQGTTADSEARQHLARVRDPVPRYIWARSFGARKIGNGSCNYSALARSTTKNIQINLKLLWEVDFDLDAAHDPISLRSWAKMAARVNASLWTFREELQRGLEGEGHRVQVVGPETAISIASIKQQIDQIRQAHQEAEAQQVADAPATTEMEYQHLKDKRSKTLEERCAERKHFLSQRYGVEVTPDLKLKDDEGWYPQLRLHYYLLHDIELVNARDHKELAAHLERGNQKLALQDVKFLGAQVQALRSLGIPELLNPHQQLRGSDPFIEHLAGLAVQHSADLKTVLNLTFNEEMTPIQIVQLLLSKLGLKLKCIKQERLPGGSRQRVYQYLPPDDAREQVFAAWQERDLEV
ncbi:DNA primase [uncultured Synechococcales cyanobacterium]|uniref:DNA primase n=1 Tax=uncultured Synechococcales cyanobacterium TaxID=1936017 RepID=A0A6J4V056_9CYAN|nr:DNA primase [uncultured Synechococcales cyanobacterium]